MLTANRGRTHGATLLGETSAEVVGERPWQQIRLGNIVFDGMADGGLIRTYRSQGLRTEELRLLCGGCSGAFPHGIDQSPLTGLCNNGWAARSYP